MRRVEPAFPDLLPVSHVLRPGYLPGGRVFLDPIRMGVVWPNAPRRILPAQGAIPKSSVRALAFGRVAVRRPGAVEEMLEAGSSVLLMLDQEGIQPANVGLDPETENTRVTVAFPLLQGPLAGKRPSPDGWESWGWGAILGLFPFPGAEAELEHTLEWLAAAGASFVITAPLLLTPKDRHRILDGLDGSGLMEQMENCLFHADVSRGLLALERRAGVTIRRLGLEPVIPTMVTAGPHPVAVRTAALLRLWARRLDQCFEESSWGWRLRRAARAIEVLKRDPMEMAAEDNLRVVPGFEPWVEGFTRSLWFGGEPVESVWTRWTRGNGHG